MVFVRFQLHSNLNHANDYDIFSYPILHYWSNLILRYIHQCTDLCLILGSAQGGGVKEKRLKRKAAKRKNKKQFIDHKTRNVKDIIGK